jgi:hypothetical protein
LQPYGVPPLILDGEGGKLWLYRAEAAECGAHLASAAPAGIFVHTSGDRITLPSGEALRPDRVRVQHIDQIDVLPIAVPAPEAGVTAASESNPLLKFSLRGRAAEYEAIAMAATPLLGDVCLSGQATVWYAPPNAGKTLVALHLLGEAVAAKRTVGGNVFYVNADDNSSGMAQKMGLMDEMGVHTLVPGQRGFKAPDLRLHLQECAERGEASGVLVVLDTLKKFCDLMRKTEVSLFANACRQFVMAGGTILGFAHTAKSPNGDGSLRYAGTTDLLDDFDAAYVMEPMAGEGGDKGERLVEFVCKKRRADSPDSVVYAYAGEIGISYEERLASVRLVGGDEADGMRRAAEERSNAELIAAIIDCIGEGIVKKMDLARTAASRAQASRRAVMRILDRYTGTDPAEHKWSYCVRERGAKVYALLADPPT